MQKKQPICTGRSAAEAVAVSDDSAAAYIVGGGACEAVDVVYSESSWAVDFQHSLAGAIALSTTGGGGTGTLFVVAAQAGDPRAVWGWYLVSEQ